MPRRRLQPAQHAGGGRVAAPQVVGLPLVTPLATCQAYHHLPWRVAAQPAACELALMRLLQWLPLRLPGRQALAPRPTAGGGGDDADCGAAVQLAVHPPIHLAP